MSSTIVSVMVGIFSITPGVILCLALSSLVNGLAVPQDGSSKSLVARDNKYLKLDFQVTRGENSSTINDKSKRQSGWVETALDNRPSHSLYSLDLLVGADGQRVTLQVDTGSLRSWIIGADAVCHGHDTTFCHDFGVYNKSTSSSSKDLKIFGNQVYGYASFPKSYTGSWTTDDIHLLDGTVINQFHFLDANYSTRSMGMLALGPERKSDRSFLLSLKKQGVINTAAFSLYLNEATAASGSIIFGGVDKAKYEGSLVTLPMKHRGSFSIKWNSITIDGKELTANLNQTLDTGSSLTYVPDEIYNAIASAVGATSVNKAPCRQPSDKYVSFNFDGVAIKVPYTDLVELRYTNGVLNEYCRLSVGSTSVKYNKYSILGDNFLRSAYVVYNLDDSTVSLAQVKYTKDSEIVAI
ncbi:aspartic peptidase domain-containing protein [Scheffersomyces xylosifermentans]|uniref:aspartic peptidase domain-containing protein n=1 Tax=Scheffersomyces xylosifermentans TaxID=1304137 RepID=UPI00315CB209